MAPPDRLLRHLALIAQGLKERGQQSQFGLNGRRGQPRRLGGGDAGHNVLGRRLREVLGQHPVAHPRELATQRVEGADDRREGRGRLLLGHEERQVLKHAVLIRHTETRESRLILRSNGAIHTGDLLGSMARWP